MQCAPGSSGHANSMQPRAQQQARIVQAVGVEGSRVEGPQGGCADSHISQAGLAVVPLAPEMRSTPGGVCAVALCTALQVRQKSQLLRLVRQPPLACALCSHPFLTRLARCWLSLHTCTHIPLGAVPPVAANHSLMCCAFKR